VDGGQLTINIRGVDSVVHSSDYNYQLMKRMMRKYLVLLFLVPLISSCINHRKINIVKVLINDYNFKGITYGSKSEDVIALFGEPVSIDSSRPGGYLCMEYHYKDISFGIVSNHVYEAVTSSSNYNPLGISVGMNRGDVLKLMKKYGKYANDRKEYQFITSEYGVCIVLKFDEQGMLIEQGFSIDLP